MLNRHFHRYAQAILLAICVISLLDLAIEMIRSYPLETGKTTAKTKDSPPKQSYDNPSLPPISAYAAVVKRPLFSDTRRPFIPEEITKKAKEPPSPPTRQQQEEYNLSGVIITSDQRLALIEIQRGRKIKRLREGEKLNGWVVASIQADQVTLKRGNDKKVLPLRVKSSSPSRPGGSAVTKTSVKASGSGAVEEVSPAAQ